MAFSSASSQLEVQSTIIVTFLLFVPLGDKRCGLLVPLKALKSKMKCDGNYLFPNELIFCFLLFIEKSTDERGGPVIFRREFSWSCVGKLQFPFSICYQLPYPATWNISLFYNFFLNVCSGCFYSHLAFLNSLFLCLGEIQVKNGLDTRDGRHRRFNTILCEFRTHEIITRTPCRFTYVSIYYAIACVPIIIKDGPEKSEARKRDAAQGSW